MQKSHLVALALVVQACAQTKPLPQASVVAIDISAEAVSRCVQLRVRGESGGDGATDPLPAMPGATLAVPVLQSDFGPTVSLEVIGFMADCSTPTGETAGPVTLRFPDDVRLTLDGLPVIDDLDGGHDAGTDAGVDVDAGLDGGLDGGGDAGVDAGIDAGVDSDGDGVPVPLDCNDNNPAIFPHAVESCSNGLDDDCDLAVDCQDSTCSPGMSCVLSPNAAVCGADGGCVEANCSNGLDDNGVGGADCADVSCGDQLCDDGLNCTSGLERCLAGRCQAATQCTAFDGGAACTIRCAFDGGCARTAAPAGSTCDDGNACTEHDSCGDGGCVGMPKSCTPSGPTTVCYLGHQCEPTAGACIARTADAGTSCATDANPCTDEVCNGLGQCVTTIARYRPCDGGTCNSAGACQPLGFAVQPSNVSDEGSYLPGLDLSSMDCELVIDTSGSSATLVSNSCGANGFVLASSLETQRNGEQAMVFRYDGTLTIGNNMEIQYIGSRPVVMMVRGDLNILGSLSVGARSTEAGAGANRLCTGGTGTTFVGALPAGGGGGGAFGRVGGTGSISDGGRINGGSAGGNAELQPLRGGCNGGGSRGSTAEVLGGFAGGALQLTASGTLTLNGARILASGGGGPGAGLGSAFVQLGGGGGGSGGGILIEAARFVMTSGAVIAANGGGGGEGRRQNNPGDPGNAGSADTSAARGGNDLSCGLGGGAGGVLNTHAQPAGANPTMACINTPTGGGGGGGSVGRVRINADVCSFSMGSTVTPPSTSRLLDGGCTR